MQRCLLRCTSVSLFFDLARLFPSSFLVSRFLGCWLNRCLGGLSLLLHDLDNKLVVLFQQPLHEEDARRE